MYEKALSTLNILNRVTSGIGILKMLTENGKNMNNKVRNIMAPILFITVVTFLVCIFYSKNIILFDSGDYWSRGELLWKKGFSIYNFPDAFRGYIFPLYVGIIGKVGGVNGFKILNSIIIGILFGYLFPRLFSPDKVHPFKIICCFLLFFVLFSGLMIHPLSDLLALGMCVCSIEIYNDIFTCNSSWKKGVLLFLCGITCYFAYNIRTIYLFADIYILVMLLVSIWRQQTRIIRKIGNTLLMAGGFGFAGIPQLLLNRHFGDGLSIWVPTSSLMKTQLFWGLQYQRYDTFAGTFSGHPAAQMYFIDSVGQALLAKEGISGFSTWGEFIKFFFKYPIEIGGIYIRHFINMLLPCWPNQYVYNLDNNKVLLALLSLIITFLFGMVICEKLSINNLVYIKFIPLLIPVLFILPGAVEVRFFIAVYLLIIYTLGFNTDWKKLFQYIRRHLLKVIIFFTLYSGVICSIWSSCLVSESAYKLFMY